MDRGAGIEPAFTASKAAVLPLDDPRMEQLAGYDPATSAWKADTLPITP